MIEFKDHKRIEKITNTEHVTRTNIQDLYEYNEKGIIYDAMGAGFTHVKTLRYQSVPISVCVFQHKWLSTVFSDGSEGIQDIDCKDT